MEDDAEDHLLCVSDLQQMEQMGGDMPTEASAADESDEENRSDRESSVRPRNTNRERFIADAIQASSTSQERDIADTNQASLQAALTRPFLIDYPVSDEEPDKDSDQESSDSEDGGFYESKHYPELDYSASLDQNMAMLIGDGFDNSSQGDDTAMEYSNDGSTGGVHGMSAQFSHDSDTSSNSGQSLQTETAYNSDGSTGGAQEMSAESTGDVQMGCLPQYSATLRPAPSQPLHLHRPLATSLHNIQDLKFQVHQVAAECKETRGELQVAKQELCAALEKVALLNREIPNLELQRERLEHRLSSSLETSQISAELYDEYEAFCNSLNPEHGQSGGFTAETDEDHQGDYIQYDDKFVLFKELCVDEMPYEYHNYRVEARVETRIEAGVEVSRGRDVDFWPLKTPVPRDFEVEVVQPTMEGGTIRRTRQFEAETWGDQYPKLYKLLIEAVRTSNSQSAKDMLIRLPDMYDDFRSGWLFEYRPDPILARANHPVLWMRWKFHSAHKVDDPMTKEEKYVRLQRMMDRETRSAVVRILDSLGRR